MESVRTCHVEILTSEFEGFCLSLAESMGAGMPGVAMECGGVIEEYLHDGENGFVVPQGDLDAMADKIVLLQSNPDLWKKLSIAARKQIHDNYNLELFGKRYSELFCTLNNSDKTFRRWSAIRPVFVSNESVCSRIVEKCGKTLKIWE